MFLFILMALSHCIRYAESDKSMTVKDKLGSMFKKLTVVCFNEVHQQLHEESEKEKNFSQNY